MARKLALAALVLAVAHTTVARADEDMGVGDQTGVSDSEAGEHGVPEVEAVSAETPSPAPQPVDEPDLTEVASPQVGIYDTLAGCESNGNWHIQGKLFSGGLQFDDQTWWAYGGGRYASRAGYASRAQQIEIAQRLHAARGWQPWPACSRKLGLR